MQQGPWLEKDIEDTQEHHATLESGSLSHSMTGATAAFTHHARPALEPNAPCKADIPTAPTTDPASSDPSFAR